MGLPRRDSVLDKTVRVTLNSGTSLCRLIRSKEHDGLVSTGLGDALMRASQAFPIVGVGASAGGLEPLQKLLGLMPQEPAMAFVVITHLNPEHVSMLPEILARATWMDVRAARDGDRIARPTKTSATQGSRRKVAAGG